MLYISFLFMVFFIYTYFLNKKYVLNLMIVLEGMMLMSIIFCFFSLMLMEEKNFLMLFLTFAACEAAMGLSLLVSFMRWRSNSLMKSISLNSW
uniref:NADH-ubiquinone oxidoreductase chain 4L n=1 Tax=Laevapex fuscus TaxID=240816 RepID=A0A8F8FFA9_9GAST|nr:NADH dehydrogenase subunit 4L [Laevapex fuscus]